MTRHSVEKTRRQYNLLVATETLEDYALRYAPSSFRKWSPLLLANTAIGSISFLALEAIGATLLLGFGYTNAVWAISLASIIIFAAGLPIAYYAARYNIDIDLLTRGAGFGYVGSTVTSLIYASFCFIFFALEAAIMAQALKLYFELPLYLGYILCSLVIIPIVFHGVTAINRLHIWTQPAWLILMLLPYYFVLTQAPHAIEALTHFQGRLSGSNEFDPYYFGIAAGISLSLIAQIGEQVDYLRFMPVKHKGNRWLWWSSMLAAGPGWIVLGCFKQLAGGLLASIAVLAGLAYYDAKAPVQMYYIAYTYVFDHPGLALFVSTVFVVISQIKINVTNAYAGSLAWSNFFSRVTHVHPGRVVWLVFNIGIALLLMELGVFEALQKVLGLYSNFAIAWIAVVAADLTINKPLNIGPPLIEFKRAHLYDYNPVGVVSMAIAALLSALAFTGLFGRYAQAYSWLISLVTGFVLTPLIALVTKGRYYIARQNVHFACSDELSLCGVCDRQYAQKDFAYCPYYDVPICSLCCTLDANCKDQCKPRHISIYLQAVVHVLGAIFKQLISNKTNLRLARFFLLSGAMLGIVGLTFLLFYSVTGDPFNPQVVAALRASLFNLFFLLAVLICILAWWIVLGHESQVLAETELEEQNQRLDVEINERKAVAQELSKRTAELALHNEILQLIGQGNKLPVICEQLARRVETLHPGMLCSILLLDEDGKHLRHGAAPSLPDFYNHAIDGLVIGEGAGSCGTAVFRGERIIVEDVRQHPYWIPFRDLARQAGVQSCWSQPFKNSKGEVLGTFAIYHRQAARPSDAEIDRVEHYANLVVLAIERKQAEQNLLLAATAFESQEGIFITDASSVILRVNQAFTNITGYTAEEAIGKNPRFLQSGRHNPDFYAAMWESIHRTGAWEGEIWNRRKNGDVYPERLVITAVKGADGILTNYVATLTDITVSKAAEEEINNLAFYDPLTGLPNRRLLRDRLQQAQASHVRSGMYGALLFIDLDNFKSLNDTLGHDKGDLLLQQVASRLATCVREEDTVARLGGDEFVIMLEDLSENSREAAVQAETVGEKILATLNQPYQLLADHEHYSTPSIGATLFSGHDRTIDDLLKQADLAMYQAKVAGRNTLRFFDPAMQVAVTAHASLEAELRLGLREKQFLLYYQPQVDDEGRITGAEALVRWQHPQRGLVSPAEFMPLAEETGLILPLGLWVLDTACAQLVTWAARRETAHLVLAVNVSVRQFHQADFVDQALAVLDHTGADPRKLKLELTESLLVSNVEDIIAKMTALKAKGMGFSLDDFGTGYSSLSYLKRLPLDQLKIDQGFVRDILIDTNDAAIAKMVVALAESLGLGVIAEGVENEAQKNFLARQGCHAYQGYLFSRALPLEEFEEFVKRV